MTLFAFILLAAFFLKDDNLVAFAVAHDRGRNGRAAAYLGIFSTADNERFDIDLRTGVSFDRRNANGLAGFDRKLFSA